MNTEFNFNLAERRQTKLRLALTGLTNGGKTVSGLYLAFGITQDWSKIAVIDSERGRALFYANRNDEKLPFPIGQFYHLKLEPPYSPARYMSAIKAAEKLVGPNGVIFVDSLSHVWSYEGGVLDIKEDMIKRNPKLNSFTAWNDAGRLQNELINTLLDVNCHTIVTMRSKMEHIAETSSDGRMVVKKLGLSPIQRDDTEYEFDVVLDIDRNHIATISKDTTFLPDDFAEMITPDLGKHLLEFLNSGTDPKQFEEEKRQTLLKELVTLVKSEQSLLDYKKARYGETKLSELSLKELKSFRRDIDTFRS